MKTFPGKNPQPPPEQQAIRNKCFHPTGTFVEFANEEVEQSIPERFEKIVQRYPDRLAVKMGDYLVTYDELNKTANRIARAIVDYRGSQPEPVAVLLEQGVPAIAAILGALKAGKFYVPVNPSFPSASITSIVENSEAKLLLTNQRNIREIGEVMGNTLQLLNIETIDANVLNENLCLSLSPDDLASIIYTSGSTGTPKGVFQNHRNVLQRALGHTNTMHICAEDRLSFISSHSTSGGMYIMCSALLNGAALFPFDFRADGAKLARWLIDERITIYQSAPPVFRQWLDTLTAAERFSALRLIRLSGMPMSAEDVGRYRSHFSQDCLLVHLFGTSEAEGCQYFIDKSSTQSESPMPVGYPIGESEVFVRGTKGGRAGPEVTGEIAIRSRYLACGYWRNSALSRARFLPDPDGGEEGIYLTGDLGRVTVDGCLYHLGRKDFKVKIRGNSVDISGIENVLREYPTLKDSVVICGADSLGEPQLIAYVVPAAASAPTVSALRNFLLHKFPEFMVPATFMTLPALPLTAGGKIDRKALPAPTRARPKLEAPYVAPRSSLERELKQVWSDVLGFDEIGMHDNFFDLGGDSLRAAQVVARIRRSLHLDIALENLFLAPTLAALADYVERARGTTRLSETPSLEIAPRGDRLPLSFAQQRLWFLEQLEPGSARYNVVHALQITGRLDAQIVQRSLNEIVRRHESLRTVFTVIDAQPLQKILPIVTVELPVIDLTDILPGANRSAVLERLIAEEAHRPFDLTCGPIIRCKLLVLGSEQYVLLLTVHHIAFDGWSGTVLERELLALYSAFSDDLASPLPELPLQYADYAAWQARSLRGGVAAKLVTYWKNQLADLTRLQLPTDKPRPAVQSCRGAREWFSLSAATTLALNALSRQEQATLFMLLLTALQTLLHRITGQTDIVTGTPVAGRRHAETEQLIGFFLNMLVLRVDLSGNPTFREALARTRQVCLDAYANEELPFEMLVEESKPERSLDHNPLFQVSFVLQNFPKAPFETADFKAVELNIDPKIARFDLHVFMTEEEDRLKGYFEYNIDLFEAATIERMVAQFQTLLNGIGANPEQRLSDLPLISEAASHQVLTECNDIETAYPNEQCVHELFEKQAERTPDAVAVVFEQQKLTCQKKFHLPPEQQAIRDKCFHPSGEFVEFPVEYVESSVCERFEKIAAEYPDNWAIVTDLESLTYAELNERGNRMARSILERVDTGSEPIGLLFDAKLTLIVAILGVLKAGKAVVLLDPSAPSARLLTMVNDTQSKLLLTEAALNAKALELGYEQHQILDIDRCAHHRGGNLQLPIRPEALIGISYSSGSTGAPKGAMWNHRSLLHQVMLFANVFHYCSRDRISYLVSDGNAALCQPFYALLVGGTVCPFDVKREGLDALALWLKQKEISVCALGAGLFRAFANIQTARLDLPHLRLLRLSSEASYKRDFALYQERLPRGCVLSNGISPSETALQSVYLMNHESVIDTDEIPIGYPVQGKEILLLNDCGEDVGFNQVGEIAVRSAYLSSGYWNRPELTSAKFTISHSGALPLYHTGDLGLRLPDGCLIYKGRKDFRLKVRGYSVEPAEVESIMRQHPGVREVCVIGRVDELSGVTRLLGYFTEVSGAGLVGSELRAFISRQLPDYMVPSACIPLTAFPLTDSGKVNRAALPTPVAMELVSGATYAPPTDQCEASLAAIWSEVLGVPAAGINDSFFDLGGDSLSAMRILARVRNSLHADVPLIEFYEAQTIAALALLVRRSSDAKLKAEKLQPRERLHPIPLSLTQERLWFIEELEPHAHRFNLVAAFSLQGPLDAAALETAINQVVQRHEVLRTVFGCADGKPFQVILDSLPVGLRAIDAESGHGKSLDSSVRQICIAEARQPFDLERGPLLRASLVRSGAAAHALILAVHHIIFDGWSMDILCRELAANYNAALARQSFEVAPLSIQYADFAIWQRDANQQQSFAADLIFWREELVDAPVLQLPTDRPRPQFRNGSATRQWFTIAPSVTQLLKDTSHEAGATLFMTLLAVYQTLLFRYSGQEDICVGVAIARRDEEAVDDLIGFFLNMLVLRADLSGNPSFSDFLARVRHRCLEAYTHQKVPFERIVEELQPNRTINQHPLFQVAFALRHGGACALHLNGLAVEELEVDSGISRFDLELYMEEKDGGLHGFLSGSSDIFDRATIARMAGHYQTLLHAIVANPKRRVGELALFTETEKQQLLIEWNDTDQDFPKDKCIHELFEEQAVKTPDAMAVRFEGQQLTYRELNVRANQLAHYLRELGVGPEVLVGIYLERSLELVIALLGILKAGGAYVPLDPTYPPERVQFMIEDSRLHVLLSQEKLLSARIDPIIQNLKPVLSNVETSKTCAEPGRSIQNPPVIYLDTMINDINNASQNNPDYDVCSNDLAYVIYTSGSTGQPKGVMVAHRALLNHMTWMQQRFGFGPDDAIVQKTPISFDASVWELFSPLISGGRMILAGPEGHKDSAYLVRLIQETAATILQVVPSMLRLLLEEPEFSKCVTLRTVFCGGETLTRDVQEKFFNRLSCPLQNLYGPTEATIDSAHWECSRDYDGSTVPIGRPITNTQIYILDPYHHPVPVSVPGEIYIGGDGLARGYLNRPELTAEKFTMHAFDGEPAQRLYKTGDLGRYLLDGNIEFLGRIDDQVKIRGHRIELGEIQATLAQHPAIRECVVVAREYMADDSDNPKSKIENQKSDRRLVAYVVPNDRQPINELRQFLEQKLPDYMVPSAFVFVPSLPLTANGKIDRKALPEPDQARADFDNDFVPPQTPSEEILCGIWAELLKLDRVGIHDNFFHLGGHSLLATQVVWRICSVFNTELTLRRFFETPTIADIIEAIQKDGRSPVQPVIPAAPQDYLPLSFAQERLWFLDQLSPDSAAYNVPTAVRLTGDLNICALEQSLNELIRRHQSLRTVFPSLHGQPSQTILPSLVLTLSSIGLDQYPPAEREAVLVTQFEEEARRPFDLAHGPLIRAHLWRLDAFDHVFLLNLHHIVSDAWSMNVFWRELCALYGGYCVGAPPPLPPLPIQYADYAVWQRDWLQGETLDKQVSYWKTKLARLTSLQLPTDHPRPAVQSDSGGSHAINFSPQLLSAIKAISRRENVTLFMALLAAFQALLGRYTGQVDIAVGTPIAGRTRRESEGLIGFFVNTLVLRADLSNNPTFMELLQQVRETTLDAYTHQDLPFEKLVDELRPERDTRISPLFQAMFILQSPDNFAPKLEGLGVERMSASTHTAKFDLSLAIREQNGTARATLNYNSDLFESITIEQMLRHFHILLEGIAHDPDMRIADLPLFNKADTHDMLAMCSGRATHYPDNKCIHQLFEDQATKTPDAVAVVFEKQQLTYRELNRKANHLADHLIKLGVMSNARVAISLERGPEMAASVLAVLKAGSSYVPLDPEYPAERLAFMLEDSQAAVLLTQASLADKFINIVQCDRNPALTVMCVERELDGTNSENPTGEVSPEAAAYVIYTSGSTGKPKGVVMEHRALVNLIHSQLNHSFSPPHARTAQFASLSFDVSFQEMFSTWLAGGALVLIPGEVRRDPLALLNYIASNCVQRLFVPFVALEQLAEAARLAGSYPAELREIITAGEQLRVTPEIAAFFERLPKCRLVNQYGPTETHVATAYSLASRKENWPALPPIGTAIDNMAVYVLDGQHQPVPTGVAGEIYIGGAGLARGYWNRPELTAERFIMHSFDGEPVQRLYKTGDLGRYRADGTIEFLGRMDNQVKIRGFRIELGEIEATLGSHEAVRECVVRAIEEPPSDSDNSKSKIGNPKSLIAYVVPRPNTEISSLALQKHLTGHLPEYMVPRRFLFVEALPLTPSGKLDRRVLRHQESDVQPVEQEYVAPRNATERQLASIWEEILGAKQVGIHANFFEFGGHSLNGMKVIARVRERYQLDAPVRWLFEAPTIAGLAEKIQLAMPQPIKENGVAGRYSRSLFELKPGGSKVVFFIPGGFGGDGEFLVYAKLLHHVGDEFTFYGLRPCSADGEQPAPQRVEDIAAEYLQEITAVDPHGPYLLVGNCIGGIVAYELARQLAASGRRVADCVLMDTVCPRPQHRVGIVARAKRGLNQLSNHYYVERAALHAQEMKQLPYPAKLSYIWALAKDLPRVERARRIRASYIRTLARYCPKPYTGLISMIVSEQIYRRDPTLGWSLFASDVNVYKARGDHESYIRDHVEAAAKQLRDCLEKSLHPPSTERNAPASVL